MRVVDRPPMTAAEEFVVHRNVALCICVIVILWSLAVVLCREWVKRDLAERLCQPIRIRWQPFAWRTNRLTCSFRVLYSDIQGRVHRSRCWTYWLRPRVTWLDDEIIDYGHEPVS